MFNPFSFRIDFFSHFCKDVLYSLVLACPHPACKIRFETEQNRSERIRTDTNNPSQGGFYWIMKLRGGLRQNFLYINEIAIFRRSWQYHWLAPRGWKREITGFTLPYSNTSPSFFTEVGPGQSGGALHSVLSIFQRHGPVTYMHRWASLTQNLTS